MLTVCLCVTCDLYKNLSQIFTLGSRLQMHIMSFIMCNALKVGTAHGCTHGGEEV